MNMQRTGAVCVGLVIMLLTLPAQAQYGEATDAPVREGRGVWVGPVNISPFLNLAGFYDSNVDFVREGEKDQHPEESTRGYSVQPGLDLTYPGVGWGIEGRGYYQMERYDEDFAESRDDWSEMLGFHAESARGLGVRVSELVQFVSHTDDSLEDRWNDRMETRLRGDVGGPVTEKSSLSVGGLYSRMDYDDEDLFGWTTYGGDVTYSRKLTDKTDGLLTGNATVDDSEGNEGTADSYSLSAGFASRATEKTGYRATLGAEYYSGFEGQDSDTALKYDVGATWRATERLSATLRGYSDFVPAEDVALNTMLQSTIGVGLQYRLLTRWEIILNGSYRREDYEDPIEVSDSMLLSDAADGGGESRTDNQFSGDARVVFGLNELVSIYSGFVYTHTISTIDEFDYDRWRASLGLALRY